MQTRNAVAVWRHLQCVPVYMVPKETEYSHPIPNAATPFQPKLLSFVVDESMKSAIGPMVFVFGPYGVDRLGPARTLHRSRLFRQPDLFAQSLQAGIGS
jgi:hypothetical protein